MGCLVNGAIPKTCGSNSGGVTQLFVGNFSGSTTYTTSGTTSHVTGITSQYGSFYEYTIPQNVVAFTDDASFSRENGASMFNHSVAFAINSLSTSSRDSLMTLVNSRVTVIVKDKNSNYWLLGKNAGLELTAYQAGTGVAGTDRNGYTLTLSSVGGEPETPVQIAYSAISALVVNA